MKLIGKRFKLLYVDDDHIAHKIMDKILANHQYELRHAQSAEEALQIVDQFLPDIIISDVVMPGMTGIELCKEIRLRPEFNNTIFLLTSSMKTEVKDAVEAIDIGADDYILKPFNPEELRAKLKAFTRIKELQDNLMEANERLERTIESLDRYKSELEEKNRELEHDKEILENSMKQVSLISKELERTNQKLKALIRQKERDFESLINLLSHLIESRRQYHRGHAKKVAEISTYIARQMGLDEKKVNQIRIAALLHELGKFGIPDELAVKRPHEYTEEEKILLSQHPIVGYELLKNLSGFEEISLIIKHQHEYMDGTGRPDRLKGEDIPIGSRILAVAGLYDNIVNRSEDGSVEKAFQIINEQVGSRFDPVVVHHLRKYANEFDSTVREKTKEVSIFELEEGMVLASDLYTRSGIKLMPSGTVLTQDNISKIIRYNKIDPLEETVFVKG